MSAQSHLSLVILAAGKGTRMKSRLAKVLHPVFYAPMLHHVLDSVRPLGASQTLVVVGHQREDVKSALVGYGVELVEQKQQNGTGHAVLCVEPFLLPMCQTVMIVCGDTPLVRPETLLEMYRRHCQYGGQLTVMTTLIDDPSNYGRVLSDANGKVTAIVEEKDATDEQRKIKEINAGIYCVDRGVLFSALQKVGTANSQGEVYLTDIISFAASQNTGVQKYMSENSKEVLGVNSRVELAEAGKELQLRRNRALMLEGVSFLDPFSTVVAPGVLLSQDVTLYPGVRLEGGTRIDKGCVVEDGVILQGCVLEENVRVGAYSVLSDKIILKNQVIAPHSVQI